MKRGFIALAIVALLVTTAVGPAAGTGTIETPTEHGTTTEYVILQMDDEIPDLDAASVPGLPPGIEHTGP